MKLQEGIDTLRSSKIEKKDEGPAYLYGGSAEQDYQLAWQVWLTLGGAYWHHVTLNNLRMLLLAIQGLHVQPDAPLGDECVRMKDYLVNDQ